MLTVAIVMIPEMFPHSVLEPYDVFSRSQEIYRARTGQKANAPFSVSLVGESVFNPVNFDHIRIEPTVDVSSGSQFDLIWIPSLMIDHGLSYRKRKKIINWIRQQYLRGAEVAAVCTGSFLLAETGLLNFKNTTLHWTFADLFQDIYPMVEVQPHLPISQTDNLYSAAADSEWLRLLATVMEVHYGKEFSTRTAEMLTFSSARHADRQPAQNSPETRDALVVKTQAWLTAHISEDNLISRAANELGLSESSLTRRFKNAHKVSVINFIQNTRIERAKEALEMTNMSIEKISDMVGYRDSSYFRRLFKVKTGMTPKQYRNTYCV